MMTPQQKKQVLRRLYPNREREWSVLAGAVVMLDGGEAPTEAEMQAALLQDVKQERLAEIRAECERRITADWTHDALGSTHTYPAGPTSQVNGISAASFAERKVNAAAVSALIAGGDAAAAREAALDDPQSGENLMCALDPADPLSWRLRAHTPRQILELAEAWQQWKQDVRHAHEAAAHAIQSAATDSAAKVAEVTVNWPS